MYFRLSSSGYDIAGPLSWCASARPIHIPEGVLHRALHNQTGHIGPLPGDMARSSMGLISGDLGAVIGDRDSGLGRSWERVHLIGVSAGQLHERRYSNYNTVIGSHGLNTAMIPFEGIANWVLSQNRRFYYIVDIDQRKPLNFTDRNGNARAESVPVKLRQALIYTSEHNPDVWINIRQEHYDSRVAALADHESIDYAAAITDQQKMKTSNWEAVKSQIAAIDQQIINCQNNGVWNLVA